MKVRQLDSNNDAVFGGGARDFLVDSPDMVKQRIFTRLSIWRGEWFLDKTLGVDYAGKVLGRGALNTALFELKATILGTYGVKNIVEFDYNYDSIRRELTINSKVNSIFGLIDFEGAIQ